MKQAIKACISVIHYCLERFSLFSVITIFRAVNLLVKRHTAQNTALSINFDGYFIKDYRELSSWASNGQKINYLGGTEL